MTSHLLFEVKRTGDIHGSEAGLKTRKWVHILPSNINQGIFSIFAFDNNDLLEETLSEHGNTHCTNGIVI